MRRAPLSIDAGRLRRCDELLDRYQPDRQPHIHQSLRGAARKIGVLRDALEVGLVSEGWEMPHCLAARVKLRSSQSARKYRIWCISMPTPSACSRRRLAIE